MRIIIVDDHQLIRSGLRDLLKDKFPEVSIHEADNGPSALNQIEQFDFDLAIVDLFMPGETAFVFIRKLCDKRPELPVLVLSASEDDAHIRKCIDLGACGFIPKSAAQTDLLNAIQTTLAGGVYMPARLDKHDSSEPASHDDYSIDNLNEVTARLTNRQLEILCMVAQGKSNKQIARDCSLSDNTVKVHVSAILKSLNLNNRTQIGLLGQRLGLVGSSQPLPASYSNQNS
jgi:DNA-binding NarL/FixJ family response regulator